MARSRSMAALVALLLCAASARVADAQGIMGSEATPSASAKYLVVGTWNNLNNQRHGVYRALVTSIELGLTLVLPPWHINYNDFPPYGTPTLMPFGYFYDPDYLIEWCKNPPPPARKCSVAKELPPHLAPACLTQLQHSWQAHESVRRRPDTGEKDVIKYDGNCPAVGNLTNALLMWTDAYNVACVSSQCTYYLQDHGDDAKFVKLRPGFKVSQTFEQEISLVLDALQQKYGTRDYVSVHARTEADWKAHCPWAENNWAKGWQCYVSDAEIAEYMTPRVPEGTLLFVATGDPLETLPILCARYRCWKRDLVRAELGPGIVKKSTSRAYLDLLLATRGSTFYGNRHSSFTIEVNEEYKTKNGGVVDDNGGMAHGLVFYYNPRSK